MAESTCTPAIVQNRPKHKKRAADHSLKRFSDLYVPTGEVLGEGSFGVVETFKNILSTKEYAIKVVAKSNSKSRNKVLKEIEIFHHCQGHPNILQLREYFEEDERFYLVFEKMEGGSLLEMIEKRGNLTEQEASLVIKDIANALFHLHKKGIAHRDLKPENILCVLAGQLTPVKICDFDLGSEMHISSKRASPITTPELQSPVGSAEFMAPEVVDVWQDLAWSYDKRCDLWSLGIILYVLLCGYPPFYGSCEQQCGWETGGSCAICQDKLFNAIQDGAYDFPEAEWATISATVKDLIGHLLVKNPLQRYSAADVLMHPWITAEASQAPLATPLALQRINSVLELKLFTENANAVNRMLLQHLSISLASQPCLLSKQVSISRQIQQLNSLQHITDSSSYVDSKGEREKCDKETSEMKRLIGNGMVFNEDSIDTLLKRSIGSRGLEKDEEGFFGMSDFIENRISGEECYNEFEKDNGGDCVRQGRETLRPVFMLDDLTDEFIKFEIKNNQYNRKRDLSSSDSCYGNDSGFGSGGDSVGDATCISIIINKSHSCSSFGQGTASF